MSAATGQLAWIAGLLVLLGLWGWQVRRARANADSVPRSHVFAAFALIAILGEAGAFVWGSRIASEGLANVKQTMQQPVSPGDPSPPARARLFLRYVQLFLQRQEDLSPANGADPGPGASLHATIGYSPRAALQLPRDYGLEEAGRSADVAIVRAAGPRGVTVEPADPAQSTRVLVHVQPLPSGGPEAEERTLSVARRALLDRSGRCRTEVASRAAPVDSGQPVAVTAILCARDATPRAALVLERDLPPNKSDPIDTPIRVRPYVWRGNGFRPHHVQLAAGTLLQIGAVVDALPGLMVWEIPAPASRSGLLFPPRNLLAPCEKWLENNQSDESGFFYPDLGMVRPGADEAAEDSFACVLPFTPPFGLEVRRLLPDVAGARTRSLWSSIYLVAPALLLIAFFFTQRSSVRDPALFARACGLGVVSVSVSALLTFRLLFAHRLDMMRDYEAVGPRVVGNELLVVLVGASLAATAAALAVQAARPRGGLRASLPIAAIAWGAFLALGWIAIQPDASFPPSGGRALGQLAFSLVVGSAVAWWPALWRVVPRRLEAFHAPPAWTVAVAGLVAVLTSALVGKAVAPLSVPFKLFAAWSFVPCCYLAARHATNVRLALIAGVTSLAALAALGRYDTGVTGAVSVVGGFFALLAVAHDRVHTEVDARRVDNFGDHYRPLLFAEVLALGGAVFAVALVALPLGIARDAGRASADPRFPQVFTRASLHLLAMGAALFGGVAYAIWRRGRAQRAPSPTRGAAPWAAIAAVLALVWIGRGAAVDVALRAQGETSERIASILDPPYALLHNERAFAKGLTAWRETAIQGADLHAVFHGQGYFGAQVLDPGVLLSIENDYLPVLLLREGGAWGVARIVLFSLVLCAGLFLVGGGRFPEGSASLRTRRILVALVGVLCVYQPLGSLGALPFTGVSWPGLGIDSPTDFWILIAILLAAAVWIEAPADARADHTIRSGRPYRRLAPVLRAGVAAIVIAGAVLVFRVGVFAVHPRDLVSSEVAAGGETIVRFNPPFEGIESVFDYMYRMQCATAATTIEPGSFEHLPAPLRAEPSALASLEKYDRSYAATWRAEESAALTEVKQFLESGGEAGCGKERRSLGHWTAQRGGDGGRECRMRFRLGWPEYLLTYGWADDKKPEGAPSGTIVQRCEIRIPEDILQTFRYPLRRPYAGARVRLVSRAMGRAADDLGELISGSAIVRLRKDAPAVSLTEERAGMFFAGEVTLPNEVRVVLTTREGKDVVQVVRPQPRGALPGSSGASLAPGGTPPRVLTTWTQARVHKLERGESRWATRVIDPGGAPTLLDSLSVIVTGGSAGRTVWLFRPPSAWPGPSEVADRGDRGRPGPSRSGPSEVEDRGPSEVEDRAVNPLLADDVSTVLGTRRRLYVYGGLVPELGWVNPNVPGKSLGLDGWTVVAAASYERGARLAARGAESTGLPSPHARFADAYCGTLDPPVPVSTGPDVDRAFGRVCAPSPLDGVLECRVSLQPELQIRLRHVLELTSARPELFSKREFHPSTASSFALLRGDTGEILAEGTFVPGRESTAYAPATPSLEKYLIDVREDRDPATGKPAPRGEAGGEKADWSQPIAVGSTMKPFLGRAVERAMGERGGEVVLSGAKPARGCLPLLGHCPPTATVWEHADGQAADLASFLAQSYNWFQAGLGFLGTALPDGKIGWGVEPDQPVTFPIALEKVDEAHELRTSYGDRPVIRGSNIDLAALRSTPMWRHFEAVLGRPLCLGKSKRQCARDAERRDLCAARALPVDEPGRDLRHLVAIGPSTFDLADEQRVNDRPIVKEYFQFLRGSGKHPLASVLQLADAFNRLFYEAGSTAPRYRLAASWYPAPAVGTPPAACLPAPTGERSVAEGLCGALRDGGTASGLRGRLEEAGLLFYGAKTGTVDSLGDLVAPDAIAACRRFNANHTTPDGGTRYHLDCGDPSRRDLNDSLLVVGFGVRRADGMIVPLTLALRYQRVGSLPGGGYAVEAIGPFLDVILDYFGVAPAP